MVGSLYYWHTKSLATTDDSLQDFSSVMSLPMGKPTICIGENKGADQLRGNREADQRLCFRNSDSTILPLLNSKISSFCPASVAVQAGLCQTCSQTTLLVFPRGGSYVCWNLFYRWDNSQSNPEVIKPFSCSTQVSMKFCFLVLELSQINWSFQFLPSKPVFYTANNH